MKTVQLIIFLFLATYISAQNEQEQNPLQRSKLYDHYEKIFEEKQGHLNQLKGTGYNPFSRLEKFYSDRYVSNNHSLPKKRIELYKEILSRQSENKSGSPIANWFNIGPYSMETYGGRVISYAFDPEYKEKFWVGSASGGLWLTENMGESWRPMSDDIPSTGIGAIAIHPDNKEIMLIGTGEGYSAPGVVIKPGSGIYQSFDRGETWSHTNFNFSLSTGVSIMDITYDPEQPDIVWAAATNGLYKSIDGGMNWLAVLSNGTNHGSFIFNKVIINKDNPNIMYVAHEGVGIYKSIDRGENFNLMTAGLPTSNINIIDITICDATPETLYASIINASNFALNGVYKTTDGGTNWSQLNSAPQAPCSPQFSGFCQGWYNNFIQVSPTDPNHVFFGGVTMWQSQDGGLTWTEKDRLICPTCAEPPSCTMYADHHAFGFSPLDSNVMISLNDGGVAISHDGGDCFEDINNELVTAQFLAITSSRIDPNIVIGGFQDHGLQGANLVSGYDWKRWGWFDGSDVEVHSSDKNIYYGTWYDGTYWKIDNRFQQYAQQINTGMDLSENTSTYFAPIAVNPQNGNNILGATQQRLYISQNGGGTWKAVLSASVISDITFSEANPDFAYSTAWTGTGWTFYRSQDGGETWNTTATAPGWRVTDIKTSAQDALKVYASRNSINPGVAHIYKSIDGGETWLPIQGDMPDITTNAIAVDFFNDDIIYAATDLGIFVTENGGLNWVPFQEGMPITYVYDLAYNPTDTSLVAGTLGRGAWKTKVFSEALTSIKDNISNELNYLIYPNPSNGLFTIELENQKNEALEIYLLNELGEKITQLFNGSTQGKNKLHFEIKEKASGLYFILIKTPKRLYTRKFVLN